MYENLKKAFREKNVSANQVAIATKIHPSDIYAAMRGDRKFYDGWKIRIADYLKMDMQELFPEDEKER